MWPCRLWHRAPECGRPLFSGVGLAEGSMATTGPGIWIVNPGAIARLAARWGWGECSIGH